VDTADPLLANARRRQRDAVAGGRLRVQARAMLVLRCQY
jgi:glycogen operon protein